MIPRLLSKSIRLITLSLCIAGFAAVTSCNTMSGVGQDIEQGGDAIQEAANN